MDYHIRTGGGEIRTLEEEAALVHVADSPECFVARFGTNHWVRGGIFAEYGDLAFDDGKFRVLFKGKSTTSGLVVTTEAFPPFPVATRLGVVAAERVAGVNLLKEVAGAVRDVIGGTSKAMGSEFSATRAAVLEDLKAQGAKLGADGLIAVSFAYSPISGKGTLMFLVAAWGTAVVFA